MKAVYWWAKGEVRVTDVPDPELINPHDAIVRVSLTATHMHNYTQPLLERIQRRRAAELSSRA